MHASCRRHPLCSSGSVAGKFSPAAAVILCSSSLVVPSCMQAVEGAHSIVLTAPSVRSSGSRRHGGAVKQEEMMATKSGPSESLTKRASKRFQANL